MKQRVLYEVRYEAKETVEQRENNTISYNQVLFFSRNREATNERICGIAREYYDSPRMTGTDIIIIIIIIIVVVIIINLYTGYLKSYT